MVLDGEKRIFYLKRLAQHQITFFVFLTVFMPRNLTHGFGQTEFSEMSPAFPLQSRKCSADKPVSLQNKIGSQADRMSPEKE